VAIFHRTWLRLPLARAAGAGIDNARFICADAATVTLPDGPFDPSVFALRIHVLL
jgi:hypothetical protein